MPVSVAFEQLPNAAPGSASGLPLLSDVNASAGSVTTTINASVNPPTRRRIVDPTAI